ncbi:30S ribosomal protein S6 [Gemmatimonadota bacterium]
MNQYENVLILDPTLEESEAEEKLEQLLELYKAEGVQIVETKDWGKRKLAYPIKKKDNGLYRVIRFDADPSVITELERRLKLDEKVMRSLIVLYVQAGVDIVEEDEEKDAEVKDSDASKSNPVTSDA